MIARLRAVAARLWRILRWPALIGAAMLLVLAMPVAYVELACRGGSGVRADYQPIITDPNFQRREANTYLTYPEWHIVYAYDGFAEAIRTGDEHAFAYLPSVAAFWTSTCTLMERADDHGGADLETRVMIHTIGVSFTVEMAAKALYEETIGRVAVWTRGNTKTAHDRLVSAMAVDYAAFLRQTPWYRYPFTREIRKLWATPAGFSFRSWERRISMTVEFGLKAAYARLIGAAAATAPAQLVIRSVVSDIGDEQLRAIPDVIVVGHSDRGVEIESPRYDLFTKVLAEIANRGGTIAEIAGNDDIMVTLTVPRGSEVAIQHAEVLTRMPRDGFANDRLLVNVKVPALAAFLNANPLGDPGLEHVFDY